MIHKDITQHTNRDNVSKSSMQKPLQLTLCHVQDNSPHAQLPGCIKDHPTLLHEHITKTDTGGIRVHYETLATLWQHQNWSTHQLLLQSTKARLTIISLNKWSIFHSQLHHKLCKPMIVSRKPRKLQTSMLVVDLSHQTAKATFVGLTMISS